MAVHLGWVMYKCLMAVPEGRVEFARHKRVLKVIAAMRDWGLDSRVVYQCYRHEAKVHELNVLYIPIPPEVTIGVYPRSMWTRS
jgi:hypothetical protein